MSYFEISYPLFKFPIETPGEQGFRHAQIAAIHAVNAYFFSHKVPAIVTMPTGTGKTCIIMALPYILRAKRVLIITPSRLVRDQIAEDFSSLELLTAIGALPRDVQKPAVLNADEKVKDPVDWHKMSEYQVVIGTTMSLSPAIDGIPKPPDRLFDLILVDEAHHSAAKTWQNLFDCFPDAQRVLFTATPFRRDQKEIKGKFVFTYDLKRAYEDKIFGDIEYSPVISPIGLEGDIAIARAAEAKFNSDRSSGYNHLIMIRTDSLSRATELLALYKAHTQLNIKLVHGKHSLTYVRGILDKLKRGELDGILTVNMFGEGFNLPNLKIAALHSPHKSLAATLQFIGRFARTTAENIGKATFFAIPSEIKVEAEKLYESDSIWQTMVQNLATTKIEQEVQIRHVIESFEARKIIEDIPDLSLYILDPYHHVKIYQVEPGNINLETSIDKIDGMSVIYQGYSAEYNATVCIGAESTKVEWTRDPRFSNIQYELFIIFQDRDTNLLFICSSRRSDSIYKDILDIISEDPEQPFILSSFTLNKTLNGLENLQFFSIGMRNRVNSTNTESYRMLAGSNADRAVQRTDGNYFDRGHWFCKGLENGKAVTLGISSASKIWSNKYAKIPEFIGWCKKLAGRMASDETPVTNCGIDYLQTGEEIERLPDDIICADWHDKNLFNNPIIVRFPDENGEIRRGQLLDFDILVDRAQFNDSEIQLIFKNHVIESRYIYSIDSGVFFQKLTDDEPSIFLQRGHREISLADYLNENLLNFYTSDLSRIEGRSFFRNMRDNLPFESDNLIDISWSAHAVDIRNECMPSSNGKISIHVYLEQQLPFYGTNQVVFYDHGSGEIADFITVSEDNGELLFSLYHCKKSGGNAPGRRVEDLYEVCGQVVKSIARAEPAKILSAIKSRLNNNGSRFILGNLEQLSSLYNSYSVSKVAFEIVIVQPGVSKQQVNDRISNILASANDYITRGAGLRKLKVWCSG